MATEYVVDCSALLDTLIREDATGDAVRERAHGTRLHAPHLIDAEVGPVLRRKVRAGQIPKLFAPGRLQAAQTAITERYPHAPLMSVAWQLHDNVSFYDALYVALAARLRLLDELARRTGRPKMFYVREAIHRHLDGLKEHFWADSVVREWKNPAARAGRPKKCGARWAGDRVATADLGTVRQTRPAVSIARCPRRVRAYLDEVCQLNDPRQRRKQLTENPWRVLALSDRRLARTRRDP